MKREKREKARISIRKKAYSGYPSLFRFRKTRKEGLESIIPGLLPQEGKKKVL